MGITQKPKLEIRKTYLSLFLVSSPKRVRHHTTPIYAYQCLKQHNYSRKIMETTYIYPIRRKLNKENVITMYSPIPLSCNEAITKNKFEIFVEKWMYQKSVILSERNQAHKY